MAVLSSAMIAADEAGTEDPELVCAGHLAWELATTGMVPPLQMALKYLGTFDVIVTETDPPEPCVAEYETTELTPSFA